MGSLVLALGASLTTCRLDKLINPAVADQLAASPTGVQDSANIGSTTARAETLLVTSADGGTLTWTATKAAAWVTLSKSSGGASDTLVVTLHPDALSGGMYADMIVFTSPEAVNDPVQVPVVFEILQPALSITPDSIVDTALQGETTGRVHTLAVAQAGRGTLAWTAGGDAAWIGVNPPSATAPGPLTVTINPSGLGVGTHAGQVVVTSPNATGSPDITPVRLTITPAPVLAVTPAASTLDAFQGSAVARTFVLRIDNTGSDNLTWTAVSSSPWLTLSKASGAAPPLDSTVVTLTPGSLAAGTYDGTITVTAPGAVGSPATAAVTFTIKPCAEPGIAPDAVVTDSVTLSDCGAPQRAGSQAKLYSVQATAGDALSFRLTAAFDAYLVLTNSAGAQVAANDECGVELGTACITNFIVPATGRYVVEATTAVPGGTGAFSLSVVNERAPSVPAPIGQFRGDGVTAIGPGVTTTENVVVLKGTLNDPNPGDSVRLEIELVGALSGPKTESSAFVAVTAGGVPVAVPATGLIDNEAYRWRARTCDKTGRCSAWLEFGNPDPAVDFFVNSVPEPPDSPSAPNQFNGATEIPVGGGTGGGLGSTQTVTFRALVTDPDPGDVVSLEVEYKETGQGFNGVATRGVAVSSGGTASVSVNIQAPLLGSQGYHWRARACDQTNACGAWVSFGSNPETDPDFHVP